jgi:hypothetical protein
VEGAGQSSINVDLNLNAAVHFQHGTLPVSWGFWVLGNS